MPRVVLHLLFVPVAFSLCGARGDEKTEFFESRIRPVLIEHCYECHSDKSDEPGGGLLLDSRDALLRGGESGEAVVPGDVDNSLLISALEYRDLEMPPTGQLPENVLIDFRRWIEMGAPDPRTDGNPPSHDAQENADEKPDDLWSLHPIDLVEIPDSIGASNSAAIDYLIEQRLEQNTLSRSESAGLLELRRRLTFDLIGLPPTSADLSGLSEEDAASEAGIVETVDRLLASDQFGERWGRHWMDVARYGESAGSSRDVLNPHAWRYRDYVIDAFNADLPFDQFVREQIAGDLLAADDPDETDRRTIATGFLAIGSKSLNGGNLVLDIADDQIDVIGKSMLGLTISCARCHDHKFDPIPTADYYALAGIFRSTETVYGGSTNRPKTLQEKLKLYLPLGENTESLVKDSAQLERQIKTTQAQLKKAEQNLKAKKGDPETQKAAVAELTAKLQELQQAQRRLAEPMFCVGVREQKKIQDWPIQVRGDKGRNGPVVPRGLLSCINIAGLPPIPDDQSGRRQLADWITHPDNPLTARVIVNRVWQHLFGRGLVESVDNFGVNGTRPSHPELLDFLAHRLVHQHQWQLKSLIRDIVLSQTYRQSSAFRQDAYNIDPDNRLLWRASRRRLEAEAIRDAMLTASGELVLSRPEASATTRIGEGEVGRNINTKPLFEPFPHRSVYLPVIRGLVPPMMKLFDFPEPSNPQGGREATTVPAQALFFMNDPFVQEQSLLLATRVVDDHAQFEDRCRETWLRTLSRLPTPGELDGARQLLAEEADAPAGEATTAAWSILCQSLFASAEFRYVQ